jgi:Bax protein
MIQLNFFHFKKKIVLKISKLIVKVSIGLANFLRYINIFEKFNNQIVGRSKKKLDYRLRQHYSLSYAKGSVVTIFIFMLLFRSGYENTNVAQINGDKSLIVNNYLKEDVLVIDQNLFNRNQNLSNSKINENEANFSDKQILGFGNNIDARTVISLFEEENYNLKDIRDGKAVEPIFLSKLPTGIDKIDNITDRKKLFIKVILPLIIYENNQIDEDRDFLNQILREKNITPEESQWLDKKFTEYKVSNKNIEELKVKMDIIPPSIALAQAAYESGWGTSRFAMEGNSLFGVRTWQKGKGMVPLERDEQSNFEVKSFKIIRASISAYKKNLNTHASYKEFREARAEQRNKKNKISGLELAKFLDKYSEIGYEYADRLQKIIQQNSLTDFDDSILSRKKKPNIV